MLLTPPPPNDTPPHPDTPTDITRTAVHPRPMQPTYTCGIRRNQRIPTTYPRNVCPQRIPNTYPYNISLQHIPNTYPYDISPKSTTPHAPMDICGNLW